VLIVFSSRFHDQFQTLDGDDLRRLTSLQV
jgi:hypothetical protein